MLHLTDPDDSVPTNLEKAQMTLSDMTGKTAGIGMETARGLAKLGASVILVGIDHAQAQQAAQDIRTSAGHDRVSAFAADLTSLHGLLQLRSQIAERCNALDVLVNNVGMNRPRRELTADGVEKMFAAASCQSSGTTCSIGTVSARS
ncbi:SDR family NAD(P)-dependent oxidoreductase [Nonomuraea terrae]|uniref:SDR family NAD(P)-dependent oxidoreductase n=1 Tax=Nonomuraea terrae TaxID=2530383 RepID=UPI0037A60FC9